MNANSFRWLCSVISPFDDSRLLQVQRWNDSSLLCCGYVLLPALYILFTICIQLLAVNS